MRTIEQTLGREPVRVIFKEKGAGGGRKSNRGIRGQKGDKETHLTGEARREKKERTEGEVTNHERRRVSRPFYGARTVTTGTGVSPTQTTGKRTGETFEGNELREK